jgi:PhzF family phenazine biosynthesis protein
MLAADLTTVQLVWREAVDRFRARDPFPVGNVVEDPATGAAAAALGAYLRWRGDLRPPARFTVSQGVEMGRPSTLEVEVPDAIGGIRVTGTAVSLDRAGASATTRSRPAPREGT